LAHQGKQKGAKVRYHYPQKTGQTSKLWQSVEADASPQSFLHVPLATGLPLRLNTHIGSQAL